MEHETSRAEPALDPGCQICDPHHHLWEHPDSVYLPADLVSDIGGLPVTSTVFVECLSSYRKGGPPDLAPVGETEWVTGLAEEADKEAGGRDASDPIRLMEGIVGFADLTLGAAVQPVLEAHIEAGKGRFRGIRHVSAWDPSPDIRPSHTIPPEGLLGHPEFRKGVEVLLQAGLSFDAWLYHPQLPELIDLARAFPDLVVVLDHVGTPLGVPPYVGRATEVEADWKRSMTELSRCENVSVKVGGYGMPIRGMKWHRDEQPPWSETVAGQWGPQMKWCIETFGVERVMFESNFPVDGRSFGYTTCWNTFIRISEGASLDERRWLFHDTAVGVYCLSAG